MCTMMSPLVITTIRVIAITTLARVGSGPRPSPTHTAAPSRCLHGQRMCASARTRSMRATRACRGPGPVVRIQRRLGTRARARPRDTDMVGAPPLGLVRAAVLWAVVALEDVIHHGRGCHSPPPTRPHSGNHRLRCRYQTRWGATIPINLRRRRASHRCLWERTWGETTTLANTQPVLRRRWRRVPFLSQLVMVEAAGYILTKGKICRPRYVPRRFFPTR